MRSAVWAVQGGHAEAWVPPSQAVRRQGCSRVLLSVGGPGVMHCGGPVLVLVPVSQLWHAARAVLQNEALLVAPASGLPTDMPALLPQLVGTHGRMSPAQPVCQASMAGPRVPTTRQQVLLPQAAPGMPAELRCNRSTGRVPARCCARDATGRRCHSTAAWAPCRASPLPAPAAGCWGPPAAATLGRAPAPAPAGAACAHLAISEACRDHARDCPQDGVLLHALEGLLVGLSVTTLPAPAPSQAGWACHVSPSCPQPAAACSAWQHTAQHTGGCTTQAQKMQRLHRRGQSCAPVALGPGLGQAVQGGRRRGVGATHHCLHQVRAGQPAA